jgi:hypothetical protein
MGGRRLPALELDEAERSELEALARRNTGQALAQRARIVLACRQRRGESASCGDAEARQGYGEQVAPAFRRASAGGAARCAAQWSAADDRRCSDEAMVVRTLESVPQNATHWSSRGMAKVSGLSTSSVQRIWRAFGLRRVAALRADIMAFLYKHNTEPRPSAGPNPPTTSSPQSSASASETCHSISQRTYDP